jgi:hypothetical protein
MNWTDQMRRERVRQINLGYDEAENDGKTQEEWDHVFQTWYTFLLQDLFARDLPGFRKRLKEMLTVAAAWGATEQRFAEGSGWEWHDARLDGAISNPPAKEPSDGQR